MARISIGQEQRSGNTNQNAYNASARPTNWPPLRQACGFVVARVGLGPYVHPAADAPRTASLLLSSTCVSLVLAVLLEAPPNH